MPPLGPKHSWFHYVKAAFGWKFRLPLLGHLPLNVFGLAGFAIVGFGHPAFWVLGMAYEAAYLLFLSGSERFQKVVDGTHLLERQQAWKQKQIDLVSLLDKASQQRYQRLVMQCREIKSNAGMDETSPADALHSQGLSQLLWTFLQLLSSRIRIRSTLGQVSVGELKAEIDDLNKKYAAEQETSPLARSLKGSLDIAVRRLENLNAATENLRVMEAELDRIEKQFSLLQEESTVNANPAQFTARLDGVMQSLQDTSRWISENREIFGSIEEPGPVETPLFSRTAIKE